MTYGDNWAFGVKRGVLAWIEIFDDDHDGLGGPGQKHRETVYQPDRDDIVRLCEDYKLDFEKTWQMINDRDPDIHGFVIRVDIYRNSQKG